MIFKQIRKKLSMLLIKTKKYIKLEQKFLKKNSNIIDEYYEGLEKIKNDPFDNSLKTHKLKGNLSQFYSCSITYSHRLILIIEISQDKITLVNIGTHDEVYK